MTKFIYIYCKAFEFLIALMLAIMVVLVFGNVVLRYGSDERSFLMRRWRQRTSMGG